MRRFIERWGERSLSRKTYSLANMWVGYGADLIVEPIGREPVDGEYSSWRSCHFVIALPLLTLE